MNISKNKDCYGCGVCAVVCSHNAIVIKQNTDGFYEPIIDDQICTDCGLCSRICAYSNPINFDNEKIELYAAWSKDADTRKSATSGGVGSEISNYLLHQGFKVVGASYNAKKRIVEHIIAETEDRLQEIKGSKYLQSYTVEAFKNLSKGCKYVVIGTPCQIASIRNLVELKKRSDDFVLIDFFCHGVPSYLLWDKYLKEFDKNDIELKSVKWRDKEIGWTSSYKLVVDSNSNIPDKIKKTFPVYYKLFLGDSCLGKACYDNCKFKGVRSCADIRLGDFWGTKYIDEKEGISCVLCFTEKGNKILSELHVNKEQVALEECLAGQMKTCAERSGEYERIMSMLRDPECCIDQFYLYFKRKQTIKRVLRIFRNPLLLFNKFRR